MKKNISKSHSESTGPKLLIQIMKKYDLIFFVAITFIISWFPWYAGLGNEVMTMGPSLAAILVTVILSGRKGLKELFRPFLKIRRLKAFWVLAILGPAVIYLIAIVISLLLGGEIPPFIMIRDEWKLLPLYLFFVVLMPWNGPIGEEIGWRGFFLTRLQSKMGALRASLIIGVIWGVWHLPTFFHSLGVTGVLAGYYGIPLFLLIYTLGTVSNSIFMTWIYNRSRGSAIVAGIVWHASINFWAPVLLSDSSLAAAQEGTQLPTVPATLYLITVIVQIIIAIVLVLSTKGKLSYGVSSIIKKNLQNQECEIHKNEGV